MRRFTALLLSLFATGPLAAAPTPSLDAYSALPTLQSPRLSPDGTRIAGLLSTDGQQFLMLMSSAQPFVSPRMVKLDATLDLTSWHWVNDEWLLLRVAAVKNLMGDQFRVTRAFGLRARDAKTVPLGHDRAAQGGADLLWIARDGSPRVLLAIQQSLYVSDEKFFPEVFEVDVSTGRMQSRARPRRGVMDWFADANGHVRLGIAFNELQRHRSLLYRERNGEAFRTVDRASEKDGDHLVVPAAFLSQPGKALAFSEHGGFNALYELDLATLSLGREVFAVPGYDLDGGLHLSPDGGALLGVSYTDTSPRTEWLDPVLAKAQRDIARAAGDGLRARIVSASRNQRQLLALVDSGSDAGTYYVVDLDRRSMQPLTAVLPALAGITPASVRSFRYHARDGLPIEAVLTLPPGREARNLPLVVMPHGGPANRDAEQFDWWAQYVAQLGYAVVQPNYRGSEGYGVEHARRGDGQWGLSMQDDLLDAVAHLQAQGIADPTRACIVGASYGGYAALRGAQRDGAAWRCAVSYAGVASLNQMLRFDSQFLYGRSLLRRHWLDAAPDLGAVSPLDGAGQFTTPVLLMHGRRDLRVPVKQSREMAERLQRAGKPVRYVEQPEADHYFSRSADRREFLQELTAFLRLHNPP